MSWLPHTDGHDEVCNCDGEGTDCDGNITTCPFGNRLAAIEYKKFSWMIPHVKRYNRLKKAGLHYDAELLRSKVLA